MAMYLCKYVLELLAEYWAVSRGCVCSKFHADKKTIEKTDDLTHVDALQGSGNKLRRELVCDILGIDKCTGKSLASMLNRFFTRAELLAALDTAKHRIQNELKLG